jgi:hypothetical protein
MSILLLFLAFNIPADVLGNDHNSAILVHTHTFANLTKTEALRLQS